MVDKDKELRDFTYFLKLGNDEKNAWKFGMENPNSLDKGLKSGHKG